MTQQRLADELAGAGLEWSRNVVANLESGRIARIDVREVVAIALVLGVSPLEILAPDDAGEIELGPGRGLPAWAIRLWWMGAGPSPGKLMNDQRGAAREQLARHLAEEAFAEGSSLFELRHDLDLMPTGEEVDWWALPPAEARAFLHGAMVDHLKEIQRLVHQLEQLDSAGDRGDG